MSVHRFGAELPLITVTLWLQSAGVAILIVWVRRALGGDMQELGAIRLQRCLCGLQQQSLSCTEWRFCCGHASIAGGVYRHGTLRSTSPRAVIRRSAAMT
jgi:hypothetical protein